MEKLHQQYEVYGRMLADFFNVPEDAAMYRAEEFEQKVKQKFVNELSHMRLLIVVDKLLISFVRLPLPTSTSTRRSATTPSSRPFAA